MAKFITLDNLERFLEKGDAHWLVRGDYDASTGVGYAEEANNLVATEGLDVLNAFSYDSVGGDASASINDGNATINELIGVDVVKNQWVAESMQTFTSSGITDTLGYFRLNAKIRHSSSSVQSVLSDARIDRTGAFNFIFKATFSGNNFYFYHRGNTNNIYFPVAYFDVLAGHTFLWHIEFTSVDTTVPNGVSYKNYALIDLTQRYGSKDVVDAIIGSDAANQASRLFAFDPTILSDISQNAGVFVPSKSAKLKSVGKNLFPFEQPIVTGDGMQGGSVSKELWLKPNTRYTISLTSDSGNAQIYITLGDYGTEVPYSSSGSPLEVSFLTPSTGYVKIRFVFVNFGTSETYRNIMLNEGSAAIPYEPYEESIANLPDIELHGMLTVQNGKVVPFGNTAKPDGTGRGRVNVVDLATLTMTYDSGFASWVATLPNCKPASDIFSRVVHAIYSGSEQVTTYDILNGATLCFAISNLGYLFVNNGSSSALPTGYIVYELAEETELTNLPVFQEFIPVKKGGTLEFLDSDGETASLQGADLFYQKDIKGFVEGVGSRADIDWNADNIVSKSEIYTKAELDARYALKETLGGTLRQLLCTNVAVGGGSLEFNNTGYLDLGDYSWTQFTENGVTMYQAYITVIKGTVDNNTKANILCPNFKTTTTTSVLAGTSVDRIGVNTTSYVTIHPEASYASGDAFKAAMKGVLLAYEKA